jgi:asparagine synthase (glutamine-hydrolysing)
MCGIAGVVHSDFSRPVLPASIQKMCDAMTHRGPDGVGQYVTGHVGIGMRRLSIIDLETGKQPITNEDETIWIVFNGEIYNYRELRKGLEAKGHRFRTTTDTEVIVHLYEDLAENCVQRLRGMFAFAIWDSCRDVLFLARDRLGIKPLYYAERPEGLIFASELKALLTHPGISRDVNPQALGEYFTHLCVPGDLSIFKAVQKLPPAHTLIYGHGQVRLRRYWHVQPSPDYERTEAQWVDELRARLEDSVKIHLVADVPVGAFLSGGLDSATMVALMSRASAEAVRTFTVGFTSNAGSFDEREPARVVAQQYATLHQECLLEPDVTAILPRIVRAFDEPFADSSAIPNWLVCQETARHVKVAVSGLGGDELFGGYERYVGLQSGEMYRRIPRPIRLVISKLVRNMLNGNGTGYSIDRLKRFVAAGDLSAVDRYRSFIAAFENTDDILHSDLREILDHTTSKYEQVIDQLVLQNTLDVGLFTDLCLYLPDDLLTLTDRISMAHSLEVRVPFVDHELVEFVARMPAHLKVRGLQKKFLFRKAIAPWVPKDHLHRRKQGFSIPLGAWLKGPLKPMLSDLVESRELRASPWLNHKTVRKLMDEHLAGKQNHEVRLWSIVCFWDWERQYASGPPSRTTASTRTFRE